MPRLILLTAALALLPAGRCCGASHFWLTTDASGVTGPESGSTAMSVGETLTLHIWGRPEDGRQFDSISLDVVASATGLDFVDGSYEFHNEIDGSTDRFEETLDSATAGGGLESYFPPDDIIDFGDVDELRGLRGFTLTDSATIRGPGPACGTGESDCEVAGDGEPAWRIATFEVELVSYASTTIDLYLQIGDRGIVERTLATGDYDLDGDVDSDDHLLWESDYGKGASTADGNGDGLIDAADYVLWRNHEGETSTLLTAADTDVRFGVDPISGDEPIHNASTDKQTNVVGDDRDFRITVVAPAFGVPEPASAALAAMGLSGLIRLRSPRPTGGEKKLPALPHALKPRG